MRIVKWLLQDEGGYEFQGKSCGSLGSACGIRSNTTQTLGRYSSR